MNPDEPLAGLPANPLERGCDDGVGAALAVVFFVGALAGARAWVRGAAQIVVIGIEADAEAEAPIEREARR